MTTTWVPLGSALVSAVAVGGVTFLATRWKVKKDFQLEINRTLRTDRISVYRDLWAITEPLAYYGRDRDLTYVNLRKLSVKLRGWYFTGSGILLSREAYGRYMALQEELRATLDTDRARQQPDHAVDRAQFARIQAQGSALRTALAADVGGRLTGLDSDLEPPRRLPDLAAPGPT